MIREYPAYGRTIAAHVARGVKPLCVGVLLSSGWRYFDHAPKVCIRPDEWAPGKFEFGFLRELHVVVVPGDEATELMLAELLVDVMRVGPRLVWAFNVDGSKLADDNDDIAHWARELAVRSGALDRLPPTVIAAAGERLRAAQAREAKRWLVENERIKARGIEALTAWMLAEYTAKDRVRALFSSPWRAPSEARAA